MKKNTWLALLLALCLCLGLLAGCGSQTDAAPAADTDASAEANAAPAAEEASDATAAAAPETDAESAEDADISAEEAEPSEPEWEYTPISYPISDGSAELDYWLIWELSADTKYSDINEHVVIQELLDATGVKLNIKAQSQAAGQTNTDLMIASGDYTDVLKLANYYTGGESQAYEDDVIVDITDTAPVYAPDWWDIMMQQPTEEFESNLVDGKLVSIYGLRDGIYTDRGLVVRYDLVKQMGYTEEEITKSVDAFTDFLYACRDQLGMEYALSVGQQGHFFSDSMSTAISAPLFDTLLVDITNSTAIANYMDGDQVTTAYIGDNYRDYLRWFVQLYNDGLFDRDFYSSQDQEVGMTRIGTGNTMVWPSGADTMDRVMDYMDEANQNADIECIPAIMHEEGYVNTWGSTSSLIDQGYSITVDCDDPTLVEAFFNYFFTQPGYIMVNYGEEGLSFEYDENGEPHFTELVTNNPDGLNPMGAAGYYGLNEVPYLKSEKKLFDAYSEAARHAIDVWTNNGAQDVGRIYPTAITLTTQESAAINNQLNDCLSYGQENLLKFMTGALDVNDDGAWQTYVDGMYSFGLQTVLDVYQNAYKEFQAGERVASSGGGNMPPPDGDNPPPPPGG